MSAHERERLSAWLDGELAPGERAEVEAHLATCAECAALLAEMGALDEASRELPAQAPSGYFDTFAGRVRARIETEGPSRARPTAPRARWRVPAWTWAAAAVLLLAVVTPLTLDRLDRDAAPLMDARTRAPEAAPVGQAPAGRDPSEAAGAARPSEVVPPATPVSSAERDEAGPADRDREATAKRDLARDRELRDRADDLQPAFAAPPAPEPKAEAEPGPLASSAAVRTGELTENAPAPAGGRAGVSAADVAPTTAVVFEGEVLEEKPAAVAEPRRQAVGRDVATPAAAPPAVTSPAKGRMAAPQAAELQEGLAREKKTVPEDARAWARLAHGTPENADAWREHREEWRGFVATYPRSRYADEGRVRVIEAGLEAWRTGGDIEDLEGARGDAEAYLDRDDARQEERVRRALDAAPPG